MLAIHSPILFNLNRNTDSAFGQAMERAAGPVDVFLSMFYGERVIGDWMSNSLELV
jgi:hypothetical protein